MLWIKAESMAKYYSANVEGNTTGTITAYTARTPELPGCKAQGQTVAEALRSLDMARIDYIWALLDEGLEIPAPLPVKSVVVRLEGHNCD